MLYFIYENDNLIGFKYNDDKYYYIKNIQEDIIGIMDNTLQQVVSYEYDSWGNILSIKDNNNNDVSNDLTHIANINPFRYRSYYYDIETKLYYLNSRYYNPEWGRFINADDSLGIDQDLLGYNLFLYSSNNSITFSDITGHWKIVSFLKNQAQKIISKVMSNVTKVIINTIKKVSKIVSIESSYTKGESTPNNLNTPNVKTGASITTTSTIGNKHAPIKISINASDEGLNKSTIGLGVEYGSFSGKIESGFSSSSVELSLKLDNRTYSLINGTNYTNCYSGISYSNQINSYASVTSYDIISYNPLIPVAVVSTFALGFGGVSIPVLPYSIGVIPIG